MRSVPQRLASKQPSARFAPALFPDRIRTGLAGLASIAALLAIFGYIVGTSWAKPTVVVAYEASTQSPVIKGVVKVGTDGSAGRVAAAKVKLVFRGVNGSVIKTVIVRADRFGRFAVRVPTRARKVSVTVSEPNGPRRSVRTTIALKADKSASLTAVFPPRGSGVLPGIFPY